MNISKPTDVCHPSHRLTNMTCEILWDIVTPNGWMVKRSAGLRQWMTPYQASAAHVCQTLSLEALEEFPEFPCFSCNSTVRNLLTQNDPRWLKWYLFRRFWLKMTPAPRLPRFTHNSMSSTALGAAAKAKDINHQPQLIAEEPWYTWHQLMHLSFVG